MFSKTCEYAIRATIYIAAESDVKHKIGITDISSHIEAPAHFTAKILQTLGHSKLVSSQKGVNGGFYMDDKQKSNKLIEIVSAIDGDLLLSGCGLGLSRCSDREPCPLHDQYKDIRIRLKDMLETSSLEDMAKKLVKGKGFIRELMLS
jgi:Rrf2 family protein